MMSGTELKVLEKNESNGWTDRWMKTIIDIYYMVLQLAK